MRWAMACKQWGDRRPCKGLSVKRYIFFRGKNLLQYEALLSAAFLEVSQPSEREVSGEEGEVKVRALEAKSAPHVSHTHTPLCSGMAACGPPSMHVSATAHSESGVAARGGVGAMGVEVMAGGHGAAHVRLPLVADADVGGGGGESGRKDSENHGAEQANEAKDQGGSAPVSGDLGGADMCGVLGSGLAEALGDVKPDPNTPGLAKASEESDELLALKLQVGGRD